MILSGDLYSKVLGMETGITIITPENYRDNKKYKVCYLLHGLMNNNSSWLNNSMINVYKEEYNIIFIMPEVQRGFYSDMKYGFDYFKYISEELPMIIEKTFNISSSREDTIVMGPSMGGYGALKLSLKYPERYGYCFAFSSANLYIDERIQKFKDNEEDIEKMPIFYRRVYDDLRSIYGDELILNEEDILINHAKRNKNKIQPEIYMFCGNKDKLLDDNRRFQDELKELGYNINYNEWEGDHDWYFFDKALKESLEIYFKK